MYPVSEINLNSICFPDCENISGLREERVLHACKNVHIEKKIMIYTKERKA